MMAGEEEASGLAACLHRSSVRITSPIGLFEATAAIARLLALPLSEASDAVRDFLAELIAGGKRNAVAHADAARARSAGLPGDPAGVLGGHHDLRGSLVLAAVRILAEHVIGAADVALRRAGGGSKHGE